MTCHGSPASPRSASCPCRAAACRAYISLTRPELRNSSGLLPVLPLSRALPSSLYPSRTGRRHPHREGRACEFRGGRRGRCFLPFGFHLGVIIRCFNTALSPLVSFSARRSFGAVACEAWQVEELVHEGLRRLDAAGKVGEPHGAAARAARLDRRRARVRLVPC